jgi:hypothetical protein
MKSDAIKFIQKKIIRILSKLRFLRSCLSQTLARARAHFANPRRPRHSVWLISSISIATDFDYRRQPTPISLKRHAWLRAEIGVQHFARCAIHPHFAVFKPHHSVAIFCQKILGVTSDYENLGLFNKLV